MNTQLTQYQEGLYQLQRAPVPPHRKKVRLTLIFFIAMWFFTVVSKSIYATELPIVETENVDEKYVEHQVEAEGLVVQGKEQAVTAMAGLRVQEILVRVGGTIEAGTPLFKIDRSDLEEQMEEQELALAELAYQISDLKANQELDARRSQMDEARAHEDYEDTGAQSGTTVNRAEEARDRAGQLWEEHLDDPVSITSDDGRDQAWEDYEAWQSKKNDLERAIEKLTRTVDDLESQLQSLQATQDSADTEMQGIDLADSSPEGVHRAALLATSTKTTYARALSVNSSQSEGEEGLVNDLKNGHIKNAADHGHPEEDEEEVEPGARFSESDMEDSYPEVAESKPEADESKPEADGSNSEIDESNAETEESNSEAEDEKPGTEPEAGYLEDSSEEGNPENDSTDEDLEALEKELAEAEAALSKLLDSLAEHRKNEVLRPDFSGEDAALENWEAESDLLEESVHQADHAVEDAYTVKEKNLLDATRNMEDALFPDRADSTLEAYEIKRTALQTEYEQWKDILQNDGMVYAESDGTVTDILISVGGRIPDTAAILLTDDTVPCLFRTTLDQEEKKYLALGDSITLKLDGYASPLKATIDHLAESPTSPGSYEVSVNLPEDVGMPGMSGTLEATEIGESHPFCIPVSAIHEKDNAYYLYVVREREGILGPELYADTVYVQIIDQNQNLAAIEEGVLDAEMPVIISASDVLESGDVVRVLQ